jgi:hypothetical protein
MCYTHSRQRRTAVTGRCDHCDWRAITTSYSQMVKFYQDHLREEHPKVWLRV